MFSPYLKLSEYSLPAERSILLSPPTNAFYGLYSAFRQRHLFLGVLSFTALLAELGLPVTLSHVPFSKTETYWTQFICAWFSIAILGLMILTLAASFLVRWPHMPVDPRTIAGAMYYVCDSRMLERMNGLSILNKMERDLETRHMRHKYGFGYIDGMSGEMRLGVDIVDDTEEAVAMCTGTRKYS